MKNYITILLISVLFSHSVWSQENETTVEESLASIHIGLLGTWLTYEKAIGDQFTINGQLGLEGGFLGGSGEFNYIFTPTVTLEPRWYYNLNKRKSKGKNTVNNGGDYFAIELTHVPNLFTINSLDNEVVVQPHFYVLPKWGLRRAIGKRFSFEFAVGYGAYLADDNVSGQFGLDLKFGYIFYKKK